MKNAVIVSACRTAIGKFQGQFRDVSARDLAVTAGKEAIRRAVPDQEKSFGIEKLFINGTLVLDGGALDEEALKTTGRAIRVR